MSAIFSALKSEPYWWADAPRNVADEQDLPQQVDVLIVGGGFSGLCAARVLAKSGKSVLVCEAETIGFGASTRNGGMLGPSFHKLGIAGLTACYGTDRTHAILRESIGFIDFVADLIDAENIDCDFQRSGRFRCASRPEHYEQMSRELAPFVDEVGLAAEMIPAARIRQEIGTDKFYGGAYYHDDGGLHPAKYHDGLVRAVCLAGAQIAAATRVTGLRREQHGFSVSTTRGTVAAGQVAICTNGYTGPITPWLRRRILPIRSTMIATEVLAPELMQVLMPTQRMYGDSRRVMAYYRPSPDGKRILFGGRAAGSADNALANARDLRRFLVEIFPQLEDTPISHVWSGLVAYTFDHAPHLGEHDGLFFAMGYCGSGVARSTFFGDKLGHKMLGDGQGETAFDDLPFVTRPLYTGRPWFMPAIIHWHRLLDRMGL